MEHWGLLLSGDAPFGGCSGESLIDVTNNILEVKFAFEPEEISVDISCKAKRFIKRLLVTDPSSRPTLGDAQNDPWLIKMVDPGRGVDNGSLSPSVVKLLVASRNTWTSASSCARC